MALIDIAQLLEQRRVLFDRFKGAAVMAAASVYAENPATENHANRMAWAEDVLLDGNIQKRVEELYRLAMTNATIVSAGNGCADSDIEWVVAHFLNTVARGA
jgi:hypothetical protein